MHRQDACSTHFSCGMGILPVQHYKSEMLPYNDIVLGFRGVTFLNELVPDNRQGYKIPVGETLLTEFFG